MVSLISCQGGGGGRGGNKKKETIIFAGDDHGYLPKMVMTDGKMIYKPGWGGHAFPFMVHGGNIMFGRRR